MRETKLPEGKCHCGGITLTSGVKRAVVAALGNDAGVRKGQRRYIHKRGSCKIPPSTAPSA